MPAGSPPASCCQRLAAIGRLEDAAAGALPFTVLPRTFAGLPQCGIYNVRVRRIDLHIVAADVLVLVEHLLESSGRHRSSDRCRAPDSGRTDARQPRRRAGWDRAGRRRSAKSAARRASPDASRSRPRQWTCRFRRRRTDRDDAVLLRCRRKSMFGSDGATSIAPIEPVGCWSKIGCQVRPKSCRLPHSAIHRADVEHIRLAGHAGNGARAASAKRARRCASASREQSAVSICCAWTGDKLAIARDRKVRRAIKIASSNESINHRYACRRSHTATRRTVM